MNPLRLLVTVFCLGLSSFGFAPPASPAGWGPRGAAVAAYTSHDAGNGYEWRTYCDRPAELLLFRRGVQVAGWNRAAGEYRLYDAATRTWSEPLAPPWAEPLSPPPSSAAVGDVELVEAGPVPNYGLDRAHIRHDGGEHYSVNGQDVDRAEAHRALQGGAAADPEAPELPDDAKLPDFTVAGGAEQRAQVLADLNALNLAGKFKVHSYAPDDWALAQHAIDAAKLPMISIQAPGGQELHRSAGPVSREALAQACAGALRKANPNYDPARTPDLSKPAASLGGIPPMAWMGAASGLALVLSALAKKV